MNDGHQPRTVDAVQTSLDIIEYLKDVESAGVTDIAEYVDRSKGTVHSHMTTLVQNEYVVNDDGVYRLSLQYLDLAETVTEQLQIYDAATEELDDLAQDCNELVQFAVEEHGRAVYIYKTGGKDAVQTASSIGNREYMHGIALGKSMLAYMDESRVAEIVDRHGLPEFTDATITSRKELFEELETIRDRGFAFDRQERIEGLRCIAAPITVNDEVMGAISISGPASRFRGETYEEELPNLVTRSANVIEINAQFS